MLGTPAMSEEAHARGRGVIDTASPSMALKPHKDTWGGRAVKADLFERLMPTILLSAINCTGVVAETGLHAMPDAGFSNLPLDFVSSFCDTVDG